MEHFFPQIQVNSKKKFFTKNGTLFSPNSSRHPRSDVHQSQIIGRDANADLTQTVGGDTAKLLGGDMSPHPPWVSAPLIRLFTGTERISLLKVLRRDIFSLSYRSFYSSQN